MNKLVKYLHLKDVGWVEMIFSLIPLLSGFNFAGLPLSLLTWVILLVLLAIKGKLKNSKGFTPVVLLAIYWLIHEFVMFFLDDVNVGGFVAQLVYFAAVFTVVPNLNINKLIGSMNWVAIVSIGGLLYQWAIIVGGGMVHPLEIPGLSMSETRLAELSYRPSSFYMEPAAYVSFMVCPLLFALIERKYAYTVMIILSIFLTTSTTGLIVSFLMLGTSVLTTQKVRLSNILLILFIGIGLFYALVKYDAFQLGVEKYESTDIESNVRIVQGPRIVNTMKADEYIFGAPYSTPYNYCMSGRIVNVAVYGKSVFMSTFWLLILCYGIIGLLFYLYIYWSILRKSKMALPLLLSLIATMFSDPDGIGPSYIFTLIFLFCVANNERLLKANAHESFPFRETKRRKLIEGKNII